MNRTCDVRNMRWVCYRLSYSSALQCGRSSDNSFTSWFGCRSHFFCFASQITSIYLYCIILRVCVQRTGQNSNTPQSYSYILIANSIQYKYIAQFDINNLWILCICIFFLYVFYFGQWKTKSLAPNTAFFHVTHDDKWKWNCKGKCDGSSLSKRRTIFLALNLNDNWQDKQRVWRHHFDQIIWLLLPTETEDIFGNTKNKKLNSYFFDRKQLLALFHLTSEIFRCSNGFSRRKT